jgi:DNA-binding MarR family transcriptional regulator
MSPITPYQASGRLTGLKTAQVRTVLFAAKTDPEFDALMAKQDRLRQMEQDLENQAHAAEFQKRLEAYKTSLYKGLETKSILELPVLQYQNTQLTGLDFLAFLNAKAEHRVATKRPVKGTGILLLSGLTTVANLGVNLLQPHFYKMVKNFAFKPHVTLTEAIFALNSNKNPYVHNQVRVVLEEFTRQGLIEEIKLTAGWVAWDPQSIYVLTEKGKKLLAQNPGAEKAVMAKLSDQMNTTLDEEKKLEAIADPVQTELSASATASPLFESMKNLFFSDKRAENGWDLLQKLGKAFKERPFYKRWFSSHFTLAQISLKVGIKDDQWLTGQLDALKSLGLVTYEYSYSTKSCSLFRLTELGTKAAEHKNPFAAGLVSREQFQRLLKYQTAQLEKSLESHQTDLKMQERLIEGLEADYLKLVQEQAVDGEKVAPILAQRDEAEKTGKPAYVKERLKVTIELLTQKMTQRKALMDANLKTRTEQEKRLQISWERYAALAKEVQKAVFQLQQIIQKTQETTLNENLADLAENWQTLMDQQGKVVERAEAELKQKEVLLETEKQRILQEQQAGQGDLEAQVKAALAEAAEEIGAATSVQTTSQSNNLRGIKPPPDRPPHKI